MNVYTETGELESRTKTWWDDMTSFGLPYENAQEKDVWFKGESSVSGLPRKWLLKRFVCAQ